jgi:hypothetical protein
VADFRDGWTGTLRIGDGPDIPVDNIGSTIERALAKPFEEGDEIRAGGLRVEWALPASGDFDALIQAANDRADRKIAKWREGIELRDIGVDPDRVIEGETVRKEIEG